MGRNKIKQPKQDAAHYKVAKKGGRTFLSGVKKTGRNACPPG
jgi:hypothetical protein